MSAKELARRQRGNQGELVGDVCDELCTGTHAIFLWACLASQASMCAGVAYRPFDVQQARELCLQACWFTN